MKLFGNFNALASSGAFLSIVAASSAIDVIQVEKTCFQVGEPIAIAFENDVSSPVFADWVGLMRNSAEVNLPGNPVITNPAALWMWTCGRQSFLDAAGESCDFPIGATLVFDSNSESDSAQEWPLATGEYFAVLSAATDDGNPPFVIDAISTGFIVQDEPCGSNDNDGDGTEDENDEEETEDENDEEETEDENDTDEGDNDVDETDPEGEGTDNDVEEATVTVSGSCIEESEAITVTFEKPSHEGHLDDWVGIYRANNLDDLDDLDSTPSLWVWACSGEQSRSSCTNRDEVTESMLSFGADSVESATWPLPSGEYRAVLSGGSSPYRAQALSSPFIVGCSNEVVDPDIAEGIATTIASARADIAAIIDMEPSLGAKFLRLAFHDCVGGCDGCVDMTNPDNAGLFLPINFLDEVVEKFESQGLTRTDIWMLASVVASDVAETSINLEFPFQWVGRQTCEQIHNGNDCGENFQGNSATCTATTGPHRELCHGDSGTTTILDFFEAEFGFDAQQVAAIMGAHTIGRMRRQTLGFDAPSGWDLTNDKLDHGYHVELAASDAPNWQFRFIENDDINRLPRRPQWEAEVNGRRLVMLHTDIALVRQIDEGVNIMEDGSVTCTFSAGDDSTENNDTDTDQGNAGENSNGGNAGGSNVCPEAAATMPHMRRYSRSRETFLNDYRDALDLMVSNGYDRSGVCPLGEICRLTLRN